MRDIRVGLIGFGYVGATFHAPLIGAVPGLRLTHVASRQPEKVRQKCPDAVVLAQPEELIAAPDVDLVVIASPNDTHHPLGHAALRAGKHVVIDKPFTVTSAQAEELVHLAEQHQRVLSVFHNRRWDSDFLTVRRCIEAGTLGDVLTFQSHLDRYRPEVQARWREQDLPGAGTLYDLGAHLIDQVLFLFGPPRTVWADLVLQREGARADDYFHLVLGYQQRRVILHAGSVVAQPGPRFQVHGSLGSLVLFGTDPQEDALKAGRLPGSPAFGADGGAVRGQLTVARTGQLATSVVEPLPGNYLAYYRGIRAALAEDAPAPVSGHDGLTVIRLIETAQRSSLAQRTLPFEPTGEPGGRGEPSPD